jgi:hypothetical protein
VSKIDEKQREKHAVCLETTKRETDQSTSVSDAFILNYPETPNSTLTMATTRAINATTFAVLQFQILDQHESCTTTR